VSLYLLYTYFILESLHIVYVLVGPINAVGRSTQHFSYVM